MHWFVQFFLLLPDKERSSQLSIGPSYMIVLVVVSVFVGVIVLLLGYLLLLQEENRFVHLKFTELNSLIFKPEIDDVALKVEKLRMFSVKWLLYKLMFDWSVLF